MGNQYTFKAIEVNDALGIAKRFRGNSIANCSACTVFEDKKAIDGKPVRLRGGQAPSGLISERGAAGAINSAFIAALESGKRGLTIGELLTICKESNTAADARADQTDKYFPVRKAFSESLPQWIKEKSNFHANQFLRCQEKICLQWLSKVLICRCRFCRQSL